MKGTQQEHYLTGRTHALYAKSRDMSNTFDVKDQNGIDPEQLRQFLTRNNEARELTEADLDEQKKVDLTLIQEEKAPSIVLEAKEAWEKVVLGGSSVAQAELEEMFKQKDWCISKGIGPEEFLKAKQFYDEFYKKYKSNPHSIGLADTSPEALKKFDKLVLQWRTILAKSDYEKERLLVLTEAAKGMSPREYALAHQNDWNKLFPGTSLESLKEKKIFGQALEWMVGELGTQPSGTVVEEEKENQNVAEQEVQQQEADPKLEETNKQVEDPLDPARLARNAWRRFNAARIRNNDITHAELNQELSTQEELIKVGIGPNGKNMREFVLQNAAITDPAERIGKAEELLRNLLPEREQEGYELKGAKADAIMEAHEVGEDEPGTDGQIPAHVGTYTPDQLRRKVQLLKDAGFTSEERAALIEAGIAGSGPDDDDDDLEDDEDDQEGEGGGKKKGKKNQNKYGLLTEEGKAAMKQEIDRTLPNIEVLRDENLSKMLGDIQLLQEQGGLTEEDAESRRRLIGSRQDALRQEAIATSSRDWDKQAEQRHKQRINQMAQMTGLNPNIPEELEILESMIPDEQISHQERIHRLRTNVLKGEKYAQDPLVDARNNLAWLQRYVRDILSNVDEGTLRLNEDKVAQLQAIAAMNVDNIHSLAQIQDLVHQLTDQDKLFIQKYFNEVGGKEAKRGSRYTIKSLEELVDLIAERGGDFRQGGKYEVRNARGEVIFGNLTAWMRERLNNLRDNLSPDSAINVFSDIRIPSAFRDISLNELVYVEGYFNKRKVIIEGDETKPDAKFRAREENVEDIGYNDIRDEVVTEAWLFGGNHSKDATYRAGRENEKGLAEMGKLYDDELFTKNRSRLLQIFSLKRSGDLSKLSKKERELEEKRGSVGFSIQKQILAYYHMMEIGQDPYKADDFQDKPGDSFEQKRKNKEKRDKAEKDYKALFPDGKNAFRETLGKEGMNRFFYSINAQLLDSKDAFRDEIAALADELKKEIRKKSMSGEELKDFDGTVMKFNSEQSDVLQILQWKRARERLMDKIEERKNNGKVTYDVDIATLDSIAAGGVEAEKVARRLMRDINNMDWTDLNVFYNKKIKQRDMKIVQNAVSEAVSYPLNLSKNDREYARNWAFGFVHWTGIAARNDTQAQGFDAWSKLINFKWYRTRGGQERTGAGNVQSLPDINRLSFTFWDGMRVQYAADADLTNIEVPPYLKGLPETDKRVIAYKESLKEKGEYNLKLIDAMKSGVSSDDGIQPFEFEGNASKDFAGVHLRQAYNLFEFMMDKQEFNLGDIMKTNPEKGKLIMDHMKAQAFMGGPLKSAKYAFDQNDYLWDTLIRDWVKDDLTGKMTFKTMRLRDYMFGDNVHELGKQVFNRPNYSRHNDSMKEVINPFTGEKETLNTAWARPVVLDLVARELQVYLDMFSNYGSYDIGKVKEIEAFLRMLSSDIKTVVDKHGRKKVIVNEPFVTNDEFKSMLKLIGTSYKKMWWTKFGIESLFAALGLVGGVIGGATKELRSAISVN